MKATIPFLLFASLALSQEATPDWFRKIDRNGDGKISRDEMPKLFDQIDADKDGIGSVAEVTARFAKANPNEPAARGALPDSVEKRSITIWSDGTRMAGDLYLPKNRKEGEKLPAIVFCAGTGGTKGGTGGRLGPIFAEKGYVALAFDYRGWGESESQLMAVEPQPKPDEKGELSIKVKALRWQMNYTDQTEDIRAAISFIAGEPSVDPQRIGVMGSSYGGGLVTYMAGTDPRVKCVVAQVPGLGGANRDRALAAAYKLHTQQARGETEPVPLETGKMTGKMERYSNMRTNAAKSVGFSALEAAAKIAVPALFVVAENEELSNNEVVAEAQRQIAARGVPSKYHVIKGITHYGIYREGFQEATALEIAWFEEHLKGAVAKPAITAPETPPAPEPAPSAKAAPSLEEGFEAMDADKSGKLSREEFAVLKDHTPYFREHNDHRYPEKMEARLAHWAFQPVKNAPAPTVKNTAWPRSEVDRFVLAELETKGLAPVGDAEPAALLRRVYLDLTGQPPAAEQVQAFLAAPSESRTDGVIDELMKSPQFGERWGRHWLDVARYAESSGKET